MSHRLDEEGSSPVAAALVAAVRAASGGLPWELARLRWWVSGVHEDPDATGVCVCGQVGLRWLYEITDTATGATLSPIGSDCIGRFDDETMTAVARELVELDRMERVVAANHQLGFGDLSRLRIAVLWVYGAVDARERDFLTAMFNRRREMTPRQERWASAILSRACGQLVSMRMGVIPRRRVIGDGGAA
ncbi:hypothetical protein [Gordonia sp. 852002-51296_SCH5728562-b]|uniref:hypothetical protein n=1 Tax=Gordonia sp. 852002-51296_SCH5728562-b TaxID=1834101 RepID=UPI0012E7646E|nr:hypothetical protein [Gordonia sp. 852002-51296_SCH5728562-b]